MDPQTRALRPRVLPLLPAARQLLAGFADEVDLRQAPGGDLAHVTGFASKAAEQAARLAGVLTLWAHLDASQVEVATMAHAIDLAVYYLSEAARLAHEATISIETERAERLRVWLLESWPHAEIVPSEVTQSTPIRGLREAKAARAAIKVLVEHGWLVSLERGAVVRGKERKEANRIVGPD